MATGPQGPGYVVGAGGGGGGGGGTLCQLQGKLAHTLNGDTFI